MEHSDLVRRRRIRNSLNSGFNQGLISQQNQHVHSNQHRNQHHNHIPQRNAGGVTVPVAVSYQPPVVQGIQVISRPEAEDGHQSLSLAPRDHFLDHPKYYEQQEKLLFLTSPQPASIRRTIVPQTPARTTPYQYDSTRDSLNNIKQRNPAQDLAENSLFSYGCMCCQCVRTTEVGITENFGRYDTLLEPGFHCLPWPCADIAGRMSLRINLIEVVCESKTLDSVFCTLAVTVPFRIIAERAYDAFYRLTDPSTQIKSYVFDVVRSEVPKMTLDELFLSKSTIANQLNKRLKFVMEDYGYEIFKTLVTDVRPAREVQQSMNEINASRRLKVAMGYLADAEMIRIRKDAEAHAESLYLQGVGVSGGRKALVKGLIESLNEEGTSMSMGMKKYISRKEVMNLLLVTQYNDVLHAASMNDSNSNMVLQVDPSQMKRSLR